MSVIFISHSSRDNAAALRVRDWLRHQGWSQVFLDLDPEQGLAPGQRWQEELKRAGEQCAAVIVLVSPNWVASPWCQVEFLLADQLGKRIFPVFVAPTPFDTLRVELKAKFQMADISSPSVEAEGFERLGIGLKRAGLSPRDFSWPPAGEPDRSIYRGLRALEKQDAAILFGRDSAITKGMDELRRLRAGARERAVIILAASGAGKSSFLRAGLIARLEREEEHFLVLPVIRPARAPISGPTGLQASISSATGSGDHSLRAPADLVRVFRELRAPVAERLARIADAGRESVAERPPTIVIPLDQAEELYGADRSEADEFLDLLTGAINQDGNALLLISIRSDAYDHLQTDRRLEAIPAVLFSLPPMPTSAFKDVIEGPAKLARPPLHVDPELTHQLLADLESKDALPLLAFTLERLASMHGAEGQLTIAHYIEGLGGLKGAIQRAVTAALGEHPDPTTVALAKRAFVPALVEVDREGAKRRIAPVSDFEPGVTALVERLVSERLLVRDRRVLDGVETDCVEVAHEAVLRQWPMLADWIAEERAAIQARDMVISAAADWKASVARIEGAGDRSVADSDSRPRANDWLVHRGLRLSDALQMAAREEFSQTLNDDAWLYLAACDAREKAEELAKDRRPRVHLSYEDGDGSDVVNLPFVVGVLADISPFDNRPSLEEREFAAVNPEGIPGWTSELQFRVANVLGGSGLLDVEMRFEGSCDFTPDRIVRSHPDLLRRAELVDDLDSILNFLANHPERTELLGRIFGELSSSDGGAQIEDLAAGIAAEVQNYGEDRSGRIASALKECKRRNPDLGADADWQGTISSTRQNLAEQLDRQCDCILHYPEVLRLEAGWRGLQLLAKNASTDVKIKVLDISKDELVACLKSSSDAARNRLFNLTCVDSLVAGEPFGAFVAAFQFEATLTDIEALAGLARLGAAAGAPVLSAADVTLVDAALRSASTTLDPVMSAERGWLALRAQPDSRFLALCAPRLLGRTPYRRSQWRRWRGFGFDEAASGSQGLVWINAAYALGARIVEGFARRGWCTALFDLSFGSTVEPWPEAISSAKASAQPLETRLADCGVIALLQDHHAGRFAAPMAHSWRGVGEDTDATFASSPQLLGTLVACLFANNLKCIARDSLRRGQVKTASELGDLMQRWLYNYVNGAPDYGSLERAARFPLRDARILVESDALDAGEFSATLHIRPHEKLDSGVPIEVAVSLPKGAFATPRSA